MKGSNLNFCLQTVYVLLGALIFVAISTNVKQPYMDEEFHLDQMRAYLDGKWTYWNQKLTTPPGTYLLMYPFLKLAQLVLDISSPSAILVASRCINSIVFGSLQIILMSEILQTKNVNQQLENKQSSSKPTPIPFEYFVGFLPTIYFFNHLFYTDSASIVVMLSVFYFEQKQRHFLAAIMGLIGIAVRQTNVIWLVYACLNTFVDRNASQFHRKGNLRASIEVFILFLVMTAKKSICEFAIEICVVLSFVAFVILNGSIVLGDKSNHESSFHPTQLLYLALFCVINLPLGVLQYVHYLRATIAQSKLRFLVISIIGAAIVAKFTIVHKFILADNRHYMFYIWKNLFAKFEFFRYAMVPVYAASMAFIMQIFRGNEIAEVKLMLLFLCSAVVLIPAGLVEVRYFTSSLCFLIIEVAQMVARNDTLNNQLQVQKKNSLNVIIVGQLAVNAVLMYVFLYRPFIDPISGEEGRFMF